MLKKEKVIIIFNLLFPFSKFIFFLYIGVSFKKQAQDVGSDDDLPLKTLFAKVTNHREGKKSKRNYYFDVS